MTQYGVSYFECRRLVYVREDMAGLARLGLSHVVHTLSEIDWYYHAMNGQVPPARSTMREIVRATHEAGLQAWIDPWSAGYVFDGQTYSRYASMNPELGQRDAHGQPLTAACPNQEAFRRFMHDWTDAAMDLDPDMILWDKPHLFAGCRQGPAEYGQGCYCGLCQSLFREKSGGPLPLDPADPSLRQFRDDTIVGLMRDLLAYARRQGARSALTLAPSADGFDGTRPIKDGPDWEALAALPGLDNLGSAPYPFALARQADGSERIVPVVPDWRPYVSAHADRVVSLSRKHGLANHLWLQGFSVPADDRGYAAGAMEMARAAGITSLSIWGLEGHADMSHFACERPAEVWSRFVSGVRR